MFNYQLKDNLPQEEISIGKYLTSFQRKMLQKSLQEDLLNSYRQRIQIMLLADEGKSQVQICRILGCCPATVRHWTHVARVGMAHQWQECPIGRHKTVNDKYLERLQELASNSPRDYGYCFQRWTANWLSKHLARELEITISDRHVIRLLKQMGLSTKGKNERNEEKAIAKVKGSKISLYDLKSLNNSEKKQLALSSKL
jgi:transposase